MLSRQLLSTTNNYKDNNIAKALVNVTFCIHLLTFLHYTGLYSLLTVLLYCYSRLSESSTQADTMFALYMMLKNLTQGTLVLPELIK